MKEWLVHAGWMGMAACAALSAWPFRFRRMWRSWQLYVPAAALAMYALYEWALPPQVILSGWKQAVLPMLLFVCVNGMAKLGILAALLARTGRSRRRMRRAPQRLWQALATLAVAAGCAAWIWGVMR